MPETKGRAASTRRRTRSASGTSTSAENLFLSSGDLCSILESCSKSGVRVLKFGSLEVSFGPPEPTEPEIVIDPKVLEYQRKEAERALAKSEEAIKEEQLQQMMLEDPSEYERLIQLEEEMEDDGGQTDYGET